MGQSRRRMNAVTAWARASVEGDRRPRPVRHLLVKHRVDRRLSVLRDQQLQLLVKRQLGTIAFALVTSCRGASHESFETDGEFVQW
jgi:hypothetical protein